MTLHCPKTFIVKLKEICSICSEFPFEITNVAQAMKNYHKMKCRQIASPFKVSLFLLCFFSEFPTEAFEMLLLALEAFPCLTKLQLELDWNEFDDAQMTR
jgi:hypothetical protein